MPTRSRRSHRATEPHVEGVVIAQVAVLRERLAAVRRTLRALERSDAPEVQKAVRACRQECRELAAAVERLAATVAPVAPGALTPAQAARIDRRIREHVPCRMPPCREILAGLEAAAVSQIDKLAAIVIACRSPRGTASARALSTARAVFQAERIAGVHVASVVCEAADVAAAIRFQLTPRGREPRLRR